MSTLTQYQCQQTPTQLDAFLMQNLLQTLTGKMAVHDEIIVENSLFPFQISSMRHLQQQTTRFTIITNCAQSTPDALTPDKDHISKSRRHKLTSMAVVGQTQIHLALSNRRDSEWVEA